MHHHEMIKISELQDSLGKREIYCKTSFERRNGSEINKKTTPTQYVLARKSY